MASQTGQLDAEQARCAFDSLDQNLVKNDYLGWEFDDLLASPWVGRLCRDRLLMQRVAIQIGRRLLINPRRLLGVPRLPSTKARAFIARAYLLRYRAEGDARWLDRGHEQLDWLRAHASRGYDGLSWANSFDFASRGGFFPAGLPTIVWTAFAARAFDLSFALSGRQTDRDAVCAAARFIRSHLVDHIAGDEVCLSYAPQRVNLVHNSNLLGAVTLLRAYRHDREPQNLDLARRALRYTLRRINPDGSWYYGEGRQYRWVDNFHTAYNLDCLVDAGSLTSDLPGGPLVDESLVERTYRYWVDHLFLSDGTPKYYDRSVAPLDIQCAAQAIDSLCGYSPRDPAAGELGRRVADWTLRSMRKRNGAFRFRRGKLWVNNLESLHWGQSTMLAALAALLDLAAFRGPR